MAAPVPKYLEEAVGAMHDAEIRAGDLRNYLTVLDMAIGVETGELNAEQRAGLEAVIMHVCSIAAENLECVAAANEKVKRLIQETFG